MKYHQPDIIMLNFPVGENTHEPHPSIISSNDYSCEKEDNYYVMMSSTKEDGIATEYHLPPNA